MNVLKRSALSLTLAGIALFAGPALSVPVVVPVANSSFELPASNNGGTSCPITGWTCVNAGVYVPVVTQYTPVVDGVPGIVPDGTQAGYSNVGSGTFSQTNLATITANTTYLLQVFIGHRSDFGFPSPGGTINLTANGTVFATFNVIDPTAGRWLNESLSFTTTSNPFVGQQLGLSLVDGQSSGQINWDNVRLTADSGSTQAIPEPGTLLLVGTLLGIGGLLRRRRKT